MKTEYYERPWKLAEFAAFAQRYVQKFSAERCVRVLPCILFASVGVRWLECGFVTAT